MRVMKKTKIFTVGHSNRTIEEFIELLVQHQISAIADVRSQPYSRFTPHFNREDIKASLKERQIDYVFMGEELGARRNESCCYVDKQAKYELIKETPAFKSGLERIQKGANTHKIAMMCSEKDPITCHRTILISKCLKDVFDVEHIVSSDVVETHGEAEQRLLRELGMSNNDLFLSSEEVLEDAYKKQADEIAYKEPDETDLVTSNDPGETND